MIATQLHCEKCGHPYGEPLTAGLLSCGVMFDCHVFDRLKAPTPTALIEAWKQFNAEPHPAQFQDGTTTDDLGPAYLCPVIVMTADRKELRRVGRMVFPSREKTDDNLAAFRAALEADPDIPRLMLAGAFR